MSAVLNFVRTHFENAVVGTVVAFVLPHLQSLVHFQLPTTAEIVGVIGAVIGAHGMKDIARALYNFVVSYIDGSGVLK